MQELLLYIVQNLTDHPDAVVIDSEETDGNLLLTLYLHPDDMGRVIGKQGRIANAIRQILKACAIKENVKVNLKIASVDERPQAND
jgi:predicted RNA-binding protein YlqC (UPF0109 family)